MFFVSDTEDFKIRKIRSYLNREPMIAVLLAAANWEWAVGRCILFLGKTANVELRDALSWCHGLDAYKDLWKEELCAGDPLILPLSRIVSDWQGFREAFNLRHRLIHGKGTCSRNMASAPIEKMIKATSDVYSFARSRDVNLNARLPIRRRKAASSSSSD